MSASQLRKGARAEVELANLLSERLGVVVKRRLGQACKRRSRVAK